MQADRADPRGEERLLVSVNVGLPRDLEWEGKHVRTSIWKDPVRDRVHVGKLSLEGDQQSDPSVHGGVEKAVYAYPSEHYAYWRRELPDMELSWGDLRGEPDDAGASRGECPYRGSALDRHRAVPRDPAADAVLQAGHPVWTRRHGANGSWRVGEQDSTLRSSPRETLRQAIRLIGSQAESTA